MLPPNIIVAPKEAKDLILPILNKMRFMNTKIDGEKLRKEQGDLNLIISRADMFRQKNSSQVWLNKREDIEVTSSQ